MSSRHVTLTDRLQDYLAEVARPEPDILRQLREETERMPGAGMQIGADQGQLMAMIVRLMGARRCLEIGTFTGYSALAVALALPDDGRIVCCDVNPRTTAVAQRYWTMAGVAGKIQLRLGPALATLQSLSAEGEAGRFDFAFIDADKSNYDAYYEAALRLLRRGGLIAIDNVLWGGAVADPGDRDADTVALRALNRKLRDDVRVDPVLLPIGDGLTLARIR
ncbi:MAG: O-methyltransferase family 3 [Rhodospirillales bacterium]|nr:O-methyltransferase family 3 [Rhodospirillales bacterium]